MKRLITVVVGLLAILVPIAAHAVPAFVNPSFTAETTGWTFSGGASSTVDGSYPGLDGSWAWVGRRDAPNALISQTVAGFTPGATYDLTFMLGTEASSYNGAGLGDTVNVEIIGAGTINQDFTQTNGTGCCWNVWQLQTYTFVASATSLTFQIHGYADGYLGHPSGDAGVDQFALTQVSVVPLPATLIPELLT